MCGKCNVRERKSTLPASLEQVILTHTFSLCFALDPPGLPVSSRRIHSFSLSLSLCDTRTVLHHLGSSVSRQQSEVKEAISQQQQRKKESANIMISSVETRSFGIRDTAPLPFP